MSGFGRRLHPPGQSQADQASKPAIPDPEQVRNWFEEVRAADSLPVIESLPKRIARFLGLRRAS